jgi:diguanylate cyclase (GGDEF)-like protein/PAS domain S-box-containing protein
MSKMPAKIYAFLIGIMRQHPLAPSTTQSNGKKCEYTKAKVYSPICGTLRYGLILANVLILTTLFFYHISATMAYLTGLFLGIVPLYRVAHNQYHLLRQLQTSEARYRLLADNSTDIIMNTDAMGTIVFISPSIEQIGQHDPDTLIGQNARDMIHPDYQMRVRAAQMQAITKPGQTVQVEFLGLPRGGRPRWFESNLRAVSDDSGEITSVVSMIRDISARKALENALADVALTDQLTALPNRRQFDLHLEAAINNGQSGCLAIIDLDHFKQVNDNFGHSGGDEVLRNFAQIARKVIRINDSLARIGGEEFALLLPHCSLEMAQIICNKITQSLAKNITKINNIPVNVTISIGLATIGHNAKASLLAADQALYRAKSNGRNQLALAA